MIRRSGHKVPRQYLSVKNCTVNGQEENFAEYIKKNGLDTKMPLVADYNGSYINTSIKSIEDG